MGDSGLGLEPCHAQGKSGGRVHEEVKHMFSPPSLPPPAFGYGHGGLLEPGATAPEPGAAAGGRTFGVELATLLVGVPPGRTVPLVVETMVQFLEEHGLESEGLFRVSGSVRAVERLRQAWEAEVMSDRDGGVTGADGDEGGDAVEVPEAWRGQADVSSVAGLLKLFLRELPDGVVPASLLPSFLQAYRDSAGDEMRLAESLRLLLAQLPGENHALLLYLCSFLVRVAQHQEVNLMSPQNLGTVFGPNFFRVSPGIEGIAEQQVVNRVTARFIIDFLSIFQEDSPRHAHVILVQELQEAAASTSAEEAANDGTQNPPPAGRLNGEASYATVAATTRKKKRNRAIRVAEEASSSSSEARPESPDGAPCPSSARRDPPMSPPPASSSSPPPLSSPRACPTDRRWPPPPAFEPHGHHDSEGASPEEEEAVRHGATEPHCARTVGKESGRGMAPSRTAANGEDMDSSHSDTEPFSSLQEDDRPDSPCFCSISSPVHSSAEALLEQTIASTVEQHLFDTDAGDEGSGGLWDAVTTTAAPSRPRRRQLRSPGRAQAADFRDDTNKVNMPACEDSNAGTQTDGAAKSDVPKKQRGDGGATSGTGPGTPDDQGGLRAKRQRSNSKRGGQPAQEAMESAGPGGSCGTGRTSATDSETDMEEGKPASRALLPPEEEEEKKKMNMSQGEELADMVNTTTLSSLTASRAPPPRNRRKPSRGTMQKRSPLPPPPRGTAPGTPWKEENNNEVVPMEQELSSASPQRGLGGPSQTAVGGTARRTDVPLLDLAGIAPDTEWGEPVRLFRDWRSESSEPHLSPRPGRLIRRLLADEADPLLSPRCSSFSHSQRYHTDPEAPPSPPNLPSFMRPRSSSLGSREEEHDKEEVTSSQLSKRIQSLKKKIRRFEERFQEEHRYRPSHSDKVTNPEVLKWMNDLARSRKQLRELRLKQSQEETVSGRDALTRQRSNTLPRSFGSSRPCELSLLPEFPTVELPSSEVPSTEAPSAEADTREGTVREDGSPAGSPKASRRGTEQPKLAHRPTVEKPKAERPTVEQTMEAIELRLKEKRQQAARPDSPKEMTREQIAAEKVAIQKSLLYFESIHGRPTTRLEKHKVKPLYDRYRSVKTLLVRARAIPIIEEEEGTDEEDDGKAVRATRPAPAQEPPAPAAPTAVAPVTSATPPPFAPRRLLPEDEEQDTDGFVSPLEESCGSSCKLARVRPDPSLSTLHAASREELMEHLRTTRSDKRRLRKLLRDFEDSFYRHTGRYGQQASPQAPLKSKNVAKEDRSTLAEQYTEYKHAKAKLRLLEALIGKQGTSAVTV
ncbi:protein FAM13A-like isoform X1 [Lampetra planeri]